MSINSINVTYFIKKCMCLNYIGLCKHVCIYTYIHIWMYSYVYTDTFFYSLFLIKGLLHYGIVLVSAIHQQESAIGIHMSPAS